MKKPIMTPKEYKETLKRIEEYKKNVIEVGAKFNFSLAINNNITLIHPSIDFKEVGLFFGFPLPFYNAQEKKMIQKYYFYHNYKVYDETELKLLDPPIFLATRPVFLKGNYIEPEILEKFLQEKEKIFGVVFAKIDKIMQEFLGSVEKISFSSPKLENRNGALELSSIGTISTLTKASDDNKKITKDTKVKYLPYLNLLTAHHNDELSSGNIGNVGSVGTLMLNLIKKVLKVYIDFKDPENYDLVALWIIGTYFHQLFNTYPYLFLHGVKQSGKSKLLKFIKLLSFKGLFAGNISPSSLFRIVQANRPTLCIDEQDSLTSRSNVPELRDLLNSGYKRGSVVYRSVQKSQKTDYSVDSFEVYCPKVLANIWGLENVLEDRCITITMLRMKNVRFSDAEIFEDDEIWQQIRNLLYLYLFTNWKGIKEEYQAMPNETKLKSRHWELWKPILTIAKYIDGETYKKIIPFAEQKMREKIMEDVTTQGEFAVLDALKSLMDERESDDVFIPLSDIVKRGKDSLESDAEWFNSRKVSNILKRLNFKEKRKVGNRAQYRIKRQDVDDMYQRMTVMMDMYGFDEKKERVPDNVGGLDAYTNKTPQKSENNLIFDPQSEHSLLEKLRADFRESGELYLTEVKDKLFWLTDSEINYLVEKLKEKGELVEKEPGVLARTEFMGGGRQE